MLDGEKIVPVAASVMPSASEGEGLMLGEMLRLTLSDGLIDAEILWETEGEMLAETLGEMD